MLVVVVHSHRELVQFPGKRPFSVALMTDFPTLDDF
jgi:hypothetical protein